MHPRASRLVGVVAVAGFLAGCSDASVPSTCELMTDAEVQAELRAPLASDGIAAGTPGAAGGTCFWSTDDLGLVFSLSSNPWHDADAENWEWLTEQQGTQAVAGIGDEALFNWSEDPVPRAALSVHQGDLVLGLAVHGSAYGGSPADALLSLTALARKALTRLR